MERLVGMVILAMAAIACMVAGAPVLAIVCFGIAFVLAVCHSPLDFGMFSSTKPAREIRYDLIERPSPPVFQPQKVVEATEKRIEAPDGSAIQVRQVRQWN